MKRKDFIDGICILLVFVGLFIIGFGFGQLSEIANYTEFIFDNYGLNMTIENVDKITALQITIQTYESMIKAIANTLGGYIIMLIACLFAITFKPKRKRPKK